MSQPSAAPAKGKLTAQQQHDLDRQAHRYNRAVTKLLDSLTHSSETVRRAEYVVRNTIANIERKHSERHQPPQLANVIVTDDAARRASPVQDVVTDNDSPGDDDNEGVDESGTFPSPEDRAAAEEMVVSELEAEAGLSIYARRQAADAHRVLNAGIAPSAPRKHAADAGSQTVHKFHDHVEEASALARVNAALDAAGDTVGGLERMAYALAEKVISEHQLLCRWARSAQAATVERCIALGLDGAAAATVLPPLPDFVAATPAQLALDARVKRDYEFRSACARRAAMRAMLAADADANEAPPPRTADADVQVDPERNNALTQTPPVGDGLAKAVRAQHEVLEELVQAVRESSNRLWGWECKPNPETAFITHAHLTDMVAYDTQQLSYLFESVRGAPLAQDAPLRPGTKDRASGPDMVFAVADATVATDPVRVVSSNADRVAFTQTQAQASTIDSGVGTELVLCDGSVSPRPVSPTTADYFNAAVAASHPGWQWRRPTPEASPRDAGTSSSAASSEALGTPCPSSREGLISSGLARQLTDEAVLRVRVALTEDMEGVARRAEWATEGLFFQRLRAQWQLEEATRGTGGAIEELRTANRRLETELRSVQGALITKTRECESATRVLSSIGADEGEDVASLDFRVYRRLVAELEAREEALKADLAIERARTVAAHGTRAAMRTVGVGVRPTVADASIAARILMLNQLGQTDAVDTATTGTDPWEDAAPEVDDDTRGAPAAPAVVATARFVTRDAETQRGAEMASSDAISTTPAPLTAAPAAALQRVFVTSSASCQCDIPAPRPPVLHQAVEAIPVRCDAAVNAVPDVVETAFAEAGTQRSLPECSDAGVHVVSATASEGIQVELLEAKYAIPPSGAVRVSDEYVQTAPSVADAETMLGGAPPSVRPCFTQTFIAREDAASLATVDIRDFAQIMGDPIPATADAASIATPEPGHDFGLQCNYHVPMRTRATDTHADHVSDPADVAVQTGDFDQSMSAASSATARRMARGTSITIETPEDVAEMMSHLASTVSILGRRGRRMSTMFESMRRRVLFEDAEEKESEDDKDTTGAMSSSSVLEVAELVPHGDGTQLDAGPPKERPADDEAHAPSNEPIARPALVGAVAAPRRTSVSLESRGVSPIDFGVADDAAVMLTVCTEHVQSQTDAHEVSDAASGEVAPGSQDVGVQCDGLGGARGLQPAISDLAFRDVQSSYSHTRGNTASSAHVFGLTGTRPNSVAAGVLGGSMTGGAAVEIASLRAQLRHAETLEAPPGGTASDLSETVRAAMCAPAPDVSLRRDLLNWRRQGASTQLPRHPPKSQPKDQETHIAFGTHETPVRQPPAPLTPDLSLEARADASSKTPDPLRRAVQAHEQSRTPTLRKADAKQGRAAPVRPRHPELQDSSLVTGSWKAEHLTPSRFGVDALPRSVAKGTVTVNTVAFGDAATDSAMQRSSSHVVKALGVAVPAHHRHRPRRLDPLPDPDAVVTYTPTDFEAAA